MTFVVTSLVHEVTTKLGDYVRSQLPETDKLGRWVVPTVAAVYFFEAARCRACASRTADDVSPEDRGRL